jgi:hypothetical protein
MLPKHLLQCVLFLGVEDGGQFSPRATGFVVSIQHDDKVGFRYLVTAEHVVQRAMQGGQNLWVRSNRKDGSVMQSEFSAAEWCFHPNNAIEPADVAVCTIDFALEEEFSVVPLSGTTAVAATPDIMKRLHMGLGDELVIAGLFRSHYGQHRNIPIIRMGNISMMPGERIWTKIGSLTAYLVETRSIGGLSGSPVFVNRSPMQIVDGKSKWSEGGQLYLLGLMHGHFDIQNINDDVEVEAGTRGINTGIGIVVPVEKILETINQPKLVARRNAIVDQMRTAQGTEESGNGSTETI